MVIDAPLSITLNRIATFTKENSKKLGVAVVNLASGQRINRPSDSIGEYFRSKILKNNSENYTLIIKKLEEGKAFLNVASIAGEKAFRIIYDMRDIVRNYYRDGIQQSEKELLKKDFESLKTTVTEVIEGSTYDGMQLISDHNGQPFMDIPIDRSDMELKIEIVFTEDDVPNVSSLTIGESDINTEVTAVEQQLSKVGSYLSKTSAYIHSLDAFYNIILKEKDSEANSAKQIIESDSATEMMEVIKRSIRNEISMAMFSQGNISRSFVLKLLG